ncbi:MAG: hypothetical protein ACI9G1_000928 [Pirellulaceae bacterium]
MRIRLRKSLIYFAAVALCVLLTRFAIIASSNEIGWETVAAHWIAMPLSSVGMQATPLAEREPSEQASFWLAETDRVVDRYPDSPELFMGAAWMLDSPNPGFFKNHVRQSKRPQLGPSYNRESIDQANAKFHDRCREHCVALAAKATKLDPSSVELWRFRALLLFESDAFWGLSAVDPRVENWLEILDQCSSHDKGNALYDYLAALTLWNQSGSYKYSREHDQRVLKINDEAGFALGTERYQEALKKKYLAIGERGYPVISKFLSHCRLSKNQQSSAALSRRVTVRHSIFFAHLWRWQKVRADSARHNGDVELELELRSEILPFFDQAIITDETSALTVLTSWYRLRTSTYRQIQKSLKDHPEYAAKINLSSIRAREKELQIESATIVAALTKLRDERYPPPVQSATATAISTASGSSTAMLTIIGGFTLAFATVLWRLPEEDIGLGQIRHSIVWILGCGGSFVILGMAPAEMISREIQTYSVIIATCLIALVVVATAIWYVPEFLRKRRCRFKLKTLFATMTAVAVFAVLWPLVVDRAMRITTSLPELWVQAKGWNNMDADVLRKAMRIEAGTLVWAAIQWLAYAGQFVGLSISLALGGCWLMISAARKSQTNFFIYWTRNVRARWSQLFKSVGQSAMIASICCLAIYLFTAPHAIRESELQFQHNMRYCRNPAAHYEEIRATQAKIKTSKQAMSKIRERIQVELNYRKQFQKSEVR